MDRAVQTLLFKQFEWTSNPGLASFEYTPPGMAAAARARGTIPTVVYTVEDIILSINSFDRAGASVENLFGEATINLLN